MREYVVFGSDDDEWGKERWNRNHVVLQLALHVLVPSEDDGRVLRVAVAKVEVLQLRCDRCLLYTSPSPRDRG